MSDKLRGQVGVELAQLRKLLADHGELLTKCRDTEPSRVELSALGALLHSFYMGMENIFERIAMEVDGGTPQGENWHRDLLASMAREAPHRHPVISEALQETLKDYLGFRHVFRNAYSFDLEWAEMTPLVLRCEATLGRFSAEVDRFLTKMRTPEPPRNDG